MAFNPCPSTAYVRLWRDLLDPNYAAGLEAASDVGGMDLVEANAAIWARVEQAANVSQQACYLREHSIATGAVAASETYATGTATLTRSAPCDWSLTVPANTRLLAYRENSLGVEEFLGAYETTAAVTLANGTPSATLPVRAMAPGFVGNLEAGELLRLAPLSTSRVQCVGILNNSLGSISPPAYESFGGLAGRYVRLTGAVDPTTPRQVATDVGSIVSLATSLDALDAGRTLIAEIEDWPGLGCEISAHGAITGGIDGYLQAIGSDRGVGRANNETDAEYRERILTVADVVTPAAIQRIVDRALAGTPATGVVRETLDPDGLMGFVVDFHPLDMGAPCCDPEAFGGSGTVLLDENTYTSHFLVCIEGFPNGEFGTFFDKASLPASLPSAFDLPSTIPLGGFLDGSAPGINTLAPRLWDALNSARAAGVSFTILVCE